MSKNYPLFLFFLCLVILFGLAMPALVRAETAVPGKFYKINNLNLGTDFNLFENDFGGGGSICTGDINGDSWQEMVVGSGPGRRSEVHIYSHLGQKTQYILYPFAPEFLGGVDVACGDLTGDRIAEIVVTVAGQEQAHVKIFQADEHKSLLAEFFAETPEFKGGVHIAIGDVDQDEKGEIIVSRGSGTRSRIRYFEADGTALKTIIYPFENEYKNGVDVAFGDVDGDGQGEIVASAYRNHQAQIKIFKANGALVNSFIAYNANFQGGAAVAVADINQDGTAEIITGAGPGGMPHVRIFNAQGAIQNNLSFYAYQKSFDQGVNVTGADLDHDQIAEIVTVPALNYAYQGPKKIVIDISDQVLKAYQGSSLFLEGLVSTGRPGMGTPLGAFKILSKNIRAWSSRYGLYMPFWMAFTTLGHGIHELPEWPGGYKEGANHLGMRVSHGCVRLGVGPAEKLFNWAEIGTPIIVQE